MNQFEWDTAADLPDDLPDAVCPDCGAKYSYAQACELDGICDCHGQLEPDE